jgi:putative protease
MKKIELLAPAKNLEFGIAAIDYGADAVYIGSPKFGARAAASNSLKDIKTLTDYAHKFYAKVYVTINTILFDYELEEVKKNIH